MRRNIFAMAIASIGWDGVVDDHNRMDLVVGHLVVEMDFLKHTHSGRVTDVGDRRGRPYVFYAASLFNAGAPFAPRSTADADLSFSAAVGGSAIAGGTLFGLFVTLGNDSGADGASGFDGVRDIVVHAGVRDDAGETIGTRGYVFSGADGSFLFTFTAGDAADEPDPPCCGGGGDTEPIGPIDPDGLINTIIDNMGMEGATLAHGDLDATTTVTTDDLILAIEWIATGELPGGAAAATSENNDPTPGGSVDCREAGGFDENGEPCADPDTQAGTPRNVPTPPVPDGGQPWEPCKDIVVPSEQTTLDECLVWAWCTAAQARADDWNRINDLKRVAKNTRDNEVGDATEEWQGSRNPDVVTPGSPRGVAERKRANSIQNARIRGGVEIVGGIGLTVTSKTLLLLTVVNPLAGGGGRAVLVVIEALGVPGGPALVVNGIDRVGNAVDRANADFRANPARAAYLNKIAGAEQNLRNTCAQLEAQADMIRDEVKQDRDRMFEECQERVLHP